MPEADASAWNTVRAFMAKTCGVILSEDQHYLLEARLAPVTKEHRFSSIGAFVTAAVSAGAASALSQALVDAMTTHETFFFRDVVFWNAAQSLVLPALKEHNANGLRIWSAACSHGQEAYSLAMLIEECMPSLAATTTIVGTDISAIAIERARVGIFSWLEVNRGLGAARLVRYFEEVAGGFRLKKRIRDRVTWSVGNLLDTSSYPRGLDLVLCRNVLIYFNDPERRHVLDGLRGSVRSGGFLGLGATEQFPSSPASPGWYRLEERARESAA